MPKKTETTKQAVLKVTFHWSGQIPVKIKRQWENLFQPKTVTFTIPNLKKK